MVSGVTGAGDAQPLWKPSGLLASEDQRLQLQGEKVSGEGSPPSGVVMLARSRGAIPLPAW